MSFTLLLILKALQNSIFFKIFLLQFSKKSNKVENQFFSKQLEMFRFCSNINTRVEPVLYLVDWWHLKKNPIMQERIEGELLLFHSVYMRIVVGCLFLFQALLLHQFGDELWSLGRNWFTRDVLHMGTRPTDIEKTKSILERNKSFEEIILCAEHVNTSLKTSKTEIFC